MSRDLGARFSSQRAFPETFRRPQRVHLETKTGFVEAQLCIGLASIAIQVSGQGQRKDGHAGASVQEFVMVPTACIHANRDRDGILMITGVFPKMDIKLRFSTETEARTVKQQLEEVLLSVVMSLHLRTSPGAPALALQPPGIARERGDDPGEKGPFLLGGYVAAIESAMCVGEPRFCMYWTELCGPNSLGDVCFYHYSSHRQEGSHAEVTCLRRSNFQLVSNVLRVQGELPKDCARHAWKAILPDEFIAFRSAEEAKLWLDLGLAAMDARRGKGREEPMPQLGRRVQQVVDSLKCRMQGPNAPRAPLLKEYARPEPRTMQLPPQDAIADHWTTRQQNDIRRLWDELNMGGDQPDAGNTGTVQFSSGTVQYSSGTVKYSPGTVRYTPGTVRYS